MRRNKLASIGVLTCGLLLTVGTGRRWRDAAGAASSATSSTSLQTTVQAVQNAAAAVAEASGSATPTAPGPASDPLPSLPASAAAPITVLSNELGGTQLPSQGSASGTNTTGQASPVVNADARSMSVPSPWAWPPGPAVAVLRRPSD